MAFEIQPDEFVQALHDDHGHGHCMAVMAMVTWLTVMQHYWGEGKSFLHDSMLRSIGTCTKKQIAALLSTQQEKIQDECATTTRWMLFATTCIP